ncbi:MAG: uracil-DNA glycosylase [Patescibacteria group bacterium UBA2103]
MTLEEKTRKIKNIRDELLCAQDAPLYQYRTENEYVPVIGEGDVDADIVIVGEAPGKNEAETGRPFCGRAGKILDELLGGISLRRESVYITNIVKDRPQENRDPTPEEIAWYAPYLDRQIEIIEPKVIVTLGRFAMEYLFKRYGVQTDIKGISNLHGTVHVANTGNYEINIVALYHPAASIYNQKLIKTLKQDFKVLKQFI